MSLHSSESGDAQARERLTELEIKASYAEDLLEQLNLMVYRQQQQIDALQRQLHELQQRQSAEPGSGAARNLRDELPPHY
ncbi:SlyX family protein [Xenophilus arseniciresistens]|uniref:SlyX family protein n=1 Tax=Xenophilus arseniciresistens TaxID=1283306 RepID=A0AAE3N9W8_9BURK|nr:SlyX family protein [Xenophilus arseniciresistens]MDA7417633.1 SlyX family protein [Xenophilus arseniciresistens]